MLLSLDIGTTNVKAVVLSDGGQVWAHAERQNTIISPQSGWQEQAPSEILKNLSEVISEAWSTVRGKEPLHGAVFSSAMHGLIALDKAGNPLTNMLLWSDMRAGAIAQTLRSNEEGMDLYRRTGVPIHAMSPLCKIIWLRENMPEVFAHTHHFADLKSYLWRQLTGVFCTDVSIASASGLLNIHHKNWDDRALSWAGIQADMLPELVSPAHKSYVLPEYSAQLRLPPDVPFIIGASDGALANIGSNATRAGQVAVTIGTSAAIRTISPQALLDAHMRTFCYCVDENRYIVGGASNNGANVLEWLRKSVFQSALPAATFVEQAAQAPAGSDGLLFLPYLLGERAPLYLPDIRGSFHYLSAQHTQAHLLRAAMEGVLFNVKMIGEALEAHSPIETLHAGGGFSRSAFWVQMLADIFQKPVYIPDERVDASLLGALLLAMDVLRLDASVLAQEERCVEPDRALQACYEEAYGRFREICTTFAASF